MLYKKRGKTQNRSPLLLFEEVATFKNRF